jgi:hypothetical protein
MRIFAPPGLGEKQVVELVAEAKLEQGNRP